MIKAWRICLCIFLIQILVINHRTPGGDIMIHGLPNSIKYAGKFHRWYDWTNGCIGVTNKEMDEIWRSVKVGTEIVIKP